MNIDNIKSQAIGRWDGIFNSLGIDVGDGKHKECPICGGNDRFRYDNKEATGTWICSQCGAGDGWAMVMNKLGLEFVDAVKEVGGIIGSVDKVNKPKERSVTPELMRKIFLESSQITKGDPAWEYLKGRGLKNIPKVLRYSSKCWESERKKNEKAMLSVFTGADGKAITMHRTYLDCDSNKLDIKSPKKILPSLDDMSGGAARLYPIENGTLGIAEGIETAIAAHCDLKIPVWASLTSTLLSSFKVPSTIKTLMIISDNDKNYAGQKAAYTLANRISVIDKIDVNVYVPHKINTDWLDVYNSQKGNQ